MGQRLARGAGRDLGEVGDVGDAEVEDPGVQAAVVAGLDEDVVGLRRDG